MFTTSAGYDPAAAPLPYVMEGFKGGTPQNVDLFDLEARRRLDCELVEHTVDFMQRGLASGARFFVYLPLTQLHYPTLPHHSFSGRTGAGDFADAMMEMDHRVGQVLD